MAGRKQGLVATGVGVLIVAALAGWWPSGSVADGAGNASTASVERAASRRALALPAVDGRPRPFALTTTHLEQAVRDRRLELRTSAGSRFVVEEVEMRPEAAGRWSAVGRVRTAIGPQSMVVTVGADAIFGVLPRPDGSQLHVTTTRGRVMVALAGGLAPPGGSRPDEPDFVLPRLPVRPRAVGNENEPMVAAASVAADSAPGARVDVLGLYTDDLVTLRGSVSAAETEVTNLFAIAHQAHVDSGTDITVRLVGLRRVTSDPMRSNRTVLDDITQNRIKGVDLVALRDSLAADLVALVRPHGEANGSCGVAWLGGGELLPEWTSPGFGFSVNNVAPCSPYVLAHELGHNLGSMHDPVTSGSSGLLVYGAYPFSFGHRQDGPPAFATIMAYPAAGQPRVGYFSDPGSTRCGAPCGLADEADNVRSLKLMASRIAAFRGPPGTISILDADAFEPEPGLSSVAPRVTVRLSGAAPAGGVRFLLTLGGGSAIAGIDYEAMAQTVFTIPAGQSEISVAIPLIGDAVVEADESLEVRLVDVVGATVDDGVARLTIRNDDPRVALTGRVRFPAGAVPPASAFQLHVTGLNGDGYEHAIEVSPPDFGYRLTAVPRAHLSLHAASPPPFLHMPVRLVDLRQPRTQDLPMQVGWKVSGQLKMPDGEALPGTPLLLDISSSVEGVRQVLPYVEARPPDFRYAVWVMPDAWVRIEATPAAPHQPFVAVRTRVRGDWNQDITLSRLPGVFLWGAPMLAEGGVGTSGSGSVAVQLSAPAPAGGVRMRYSTVDGSATADVDYKPASGVLEFAPGEKSKTIQIEWMGDDRIEGDEHFRVVLSEVGGAEPVTTELVMWLDEPDPVMSRPLPPEVAP